MYKNYTDARYIEARICSDNACPVDGTGSKYEILPRQAIGAVPHAYRAQYASYGGGHMYHVVVAKDDGDYTVSTMRSKASRTLDPTSPI